MQKENLEQKIGLMETFRRIAGRKVGVYAIASILTLGGIVFGGCELDEGDNGSGGSSSNGCTHNVGGKAGYAESGCSSGYHCESYTYTSGKDGMGPTKTSYHCVSDTSDDTPHHKDY